MTAMSIPFDDQLPDPRINPDSVNEVKGIQPGWFEGIFMIYYQQTAGGH